MLELWGEQVKIKRALKCIRLSKGTDVIVSFQSDLDKHMEEPHTKEFLQKWNGELKQQEMEIQFFKPVAK